MTEQAEKTIVICGHCNSKFRVPSSLCERGAVRPCPKCQSPVKLMLPAAQQVDLQQSKATAQLPVESTILPNLAVSVPLSSANWIQRKWALCVVVVLLAGISIPIGSYLIDPNGRKQNDDTVAIEPHVSDSRPTVSDEAKVASPSLETSKSALRNPFPEDIREIARLISMDYTAGLTGFSLQEASKEEIKSHLVKTRARNAHLELLAQRNDPLVSSLARRLSSEITDLNRIYYSQASPEIIREFADIGLAFEAASSRFLSMAELQLAIITYVSSTQSLAPELVRWFEDHARPKEFSENLKCSLEGPDVVLENTTQHDLSDSLIIFEFVNSWEQNRHATAYVESWKPGTQVKIAGFNVDVQFAVATHFRVIGWTARGPETTFAKYGAFETLGEQTRKAIEERELDRAKLLLQSMRTLLAKDPDSYRDEFRKKKILDISMKLESADANSIMRNRSVTEGLGAALAKRQKATPWPSFELWQKLAQGDGVIESIPPLVTEEKRGHASQKHAVRGAAFFNNGEHYLTSADTLRFWNTKTNRSTEWLKHGKDCGVLRVSPQQDGIVIGHIGGIEVLNTKGERQFVAPLKSSKRKSQNLRTPQVLEMIPDGTRLFCGVDFNELWVGNAQGWDCFDVAAPVSALKHTPEALFVGLSNGQIERRTVEDISYSGNIEYPRQAYPVVDFAILNDSLMVSAACQVGTGLEILVFERTTGTVIGAHSLRAPVQLARLDVPRNRMVCGMNDGSVTIYDLSQFPKVLFSRDGKRVPVTALDIHSTTGAIMACFGSGEIVVFQWRQVN